MAKLLRQRELEAQRRGRVHRDRMALWWARARQALVLIVVLSVVFVFVRQLFEWQNRRNLQLETRDGHGTTWLPQRWMHFGSSVPTDEDAYTSNWRIADVFTAVRKDIERLYN